MTRSLPGAMVLLAAFLAIAAAAVRFAPEPEDEAGVGVEPHPCWNRLPFASIWMEDRLVFEVVDAPDGPWAVDALAYALYPAYVEPAPGEEPPPPPPVLEGTFSEAAAASPEATVRYEDVAGEPTLVEVGDRLVVADPGYPTLDVRALDGLVVGGTGLCF